MYQDGLKHELDEVFYGIKRGKRRSFFNERWNHFTAKIDYWNRQGEPNEMAYCKGRAEFLSWTLFSRYKKSEKPKFYVNYDIEPIDEVEFQETRKKFQKTRKTPKVPD